MREEAIIRLEHVSYQYPNGKPFALTNVDLTIHRGEFVGVIGPTGAGKTTLCLMMNGIIPQFYGGRFFGSVTIAAHDTIDTPVRNLARFIGQVFEDPETQLLATSVENEVAFPLENLGYAPTEIRERVTWALEITGLLGLEKRHPQGLSGGQKQRLAIAAAVAVRPDVLVLDEPTSQLDGVGAKEVLSALARLNQSSGLTILMVSHQSEQLAEYASRLVLLMDGKVAVDGTPREVYAKTDLIRQCGLRLPEVVDIFDRMVKAGMDGEPIPMKLTEGIAGLRRIAAHTPIVDRCLHDPPLNPLEPSDPVISVEGIHYRFSDGIQAISGINLTVHSGEYLLLAGRNGAGKTTLVKALLNLVRPQEGRIFVRGKDIQSMPVSVLARIIGYVGQNPDAQVFTSSVWDEVAFALKFQGAAEVDINQRVTKGLGEVGLLSLRDRHPYSLSKGDRARVVIAAILALQPEVIIFDEPTVGQDYAGARNILDLTKQLHEMGKTVIVITHHLYLMPVYAQRMVVLDMGKVTMDAPLRAAYHRANDLRENHLEPPPSVYLAQEIARMTGKEAWQVTPEEIFDSFLHPGIEEDRRCSEILRP